MSNLLSEGGFGCIYYPGISCKSKSTNKKEMVTKIQLENFNSNNEIEIGKLIKKITGYQLFFLPVVSNCKINVRKMEKNDIEIDKCPIIEGKNQSLIAMDIPYVNQVPFVDIIKTRSSNNIILTIIESYKYLLNSINSLIKINIVHFDLKLENILFKDETTNPRIIDFGISIPIDKINENNIKNYFYAYAPSYYIWCIDIDIICYLLHNTNESLTDEEAEQIAINSVANNLALEIFSEDFNKKYLEITKKEVKKYVGKESSEVIEKLKSFYKTWDNYSLSIIYLRIISLLFPNDEHKNTLIILFSQLLLLNIHPDPTKRLTIEETLRRFGDIFYLDDDVESYVNLSRNFIHNKINTTRRIEEDINNLKKPVKT